MIDFVYLNFTFLYTLRIITFAITADTTETECQQNVTRANAWV
jgi:hypothetical protein